MDYSSGYHDVATASRPTQPSHSMCTIAVHPPGCCGELPIQQQPILVEWVSATLAKPIGEPKEEGVDVSSNNRGCRLIYSPSRSSRRQVPAGGYWVRPCQHDFQHHSCFSPDRCWNTLALLPCLFPPRPSAQRNSAPASQPGKPADNLVLHYVGSPCGITCFSGHPSPARYKAKWKFGSTPHNQALPLLLSASSSSGGVTPFSRIMASGSSGSEPERLNVSVGAAPSFSRSCVCWTSARKNIGPESRRICTVGAGMQAAWCRVSRVERVSEARTLQISKQGFIPRDSH